MAVKVGDLAPDFSVPGTGGIKYSLSDFKGQKVVLVFYPGDATPVCTAQLNSYSNDFDTFEKVNAAVLAISPQDVDSHEQFSAAHGGFAFPLLHDEGKNVGDSYGVLGPLGFYRRSIFVIDEQGVIRYIKRATAGLSYVKSSDIAQVIHAIA